MTKVISNGLAREVLLAETIEKASARPVLLIALGNVAKLAIRSNYRPRLRRAIEAAFERLVMTTADMEAVGHHALARVQS
jgi:hypothetical protein